MLCSRIFLWHDLRRICWSKRIIHKLSPNWLSLLKFDKCFSQKVCSGNGFLLQTFFLEVYEIWFPFLHDIGTWIKYYHVNLRVKCRAKRSLYRDILHYQQFLCHGQIIIFASSKTLSQEIFMPPSMFNTIFCLVSLSVCTQKTLTLAISFTCSVKEISYFTCVFLGLRPFLWHQGKGQISRSLL